jgi:hypothetical protein
LIFNVATEDADFVIAVLLEVETILFAKTKLEQVIVKTFFTDSNFGSSVFKTVSDEVSISVDTVIEFSPKRDFLDDVRD